MCVGLCQTSLSEQNTNISVLICELNIERGHELENEVSNVELQASKLQETPQHKLIIQGTYDG